MMRNKWFGLLAVILLIVVVNALFWFSRFPNLDGADIVQITFKDTQGDVISDWSIASDMEWWSMGRTDRTIKRSMQQVLRAFDEDEKVERSQAAPDYMVQIVTKSGHSMNKLVWLKAGTPATFVNGTLEEAMAVTEAYPIPDKERDRLLELIGR